MCFFKHENLDPKNKTQDFEKVHNRSRLRTENFPSHLCFCIFRFYKTNARNIRHASEDFTMAAILMIGSSIHSYDDS